MEKVKLGKELSYVKKAYTKKLKVIKDNLNEEYNDIIDWNTAEVIILKDIAEVTNFHGDVHIKLRANITNKKMCMFVNEIENLLEENKVGLYMQHDFYGDEENNPFFTEEDEIEIIFCNDSLKQRCKNYLFNIMFNAFYRKEDQKVYENVVLNELVD